MENSVTYTRCADYYIPNISISESSLHNPIGKYGRMRKAYLQKHRPVLWNHMILSETLYTHLCEIDEAANMRMEQMMRSLMEQSGATEELKAKDSMAWVGLMNSLKIQAEETILNELIYS